MKSRLKLNEKLLKLEKLQPNGLIGSQMKLMIKQKIGIKLFHYLHFNPCL